jgi:hypothetical protein
VSTDAPYFCPTSGQMESHTQGGFDVCCDRPQLHQPVPLLTPADLFATPPRSWVLPTIPAGVRLRDERDGHTWTPTEDPDLVGEYWTDGEAVISLGQLLQTRGRLTEVTEEGDTNG